MDPLTAFTNVATALLEFMTEVVKGQTPTQKAQFWEYYLKDIAALRKLFGLPE